MKSLQGLPTLISASVGAPGKARNVPADVQCIQYLFSVIMAKLGFLLVENGKCDGRLVQCISQYQFPYFKYAHPDGAIDPAHPDVPQCVRQHRRRHCPGDRQPLAEPHAGDD